eukprot:GFKZ01005279.1.p1 GENE.GFKZ01005279.1~~GFKZ01005279.1.p1  ORF type:complete len:371 (+),score=57.43 GFKZ01005279.1:337-1449(+)
MTVRKAEGGAQVPDEAAQPQIFGYSNGSLSNFHSNTNLMELDKALNYEIRVVTGNANRHLAEEIASHLKVRITSALVTRFSDGETRVHIEDNVRGKDVFIVQPTSPPVNDHLMELLVIIDTLKRASAKRITAVIPYYGYGRQDRKAAPRVPITARLVADLIQTAGAHRVLAFELHAGQIQGFFNIPVDHMFALPVFVNYLQGCPEFRAMRQANSNPLVVVSPDAGGMERARLLAKGLDAALAIIDKRRSAPNVAHVLHVIGEVEGRDCVIVDDMVDTAGTLTKAAEALKNNGAKSVRACCIHAVLSGPAVDRIKNSCIEELVITNSIRLSKEVEQALPCITKISVGRLMAETISRVHREESVSTLFGTNM